VKRHRIINWLENNGHDVIDNPTILLLDGLDEAFMGVTELWRESTIVTVANYDYKKCVNTLMKRDGMPYEEAMEFIESQSIGAYVGIYTPVFSHNVA